MASPYPAILGRSHFARGSKVLMEVDNNALLIFVNPQGILGKQLRPHLIKYCYYSTELNVIRLFKKN